MNKRFNFLYFRIIPLLLAIFFIAVLSSVIFNSYAITTNISWATLLIPEFFGILIYALIIIFIWNFFIKKTHHFNNKNNERRLLIVFFLILLSVQIIIALQISAPLPPTCIQSVCSWDFNVIADGASQITLSQATIDYLHMCSNNIFFFGLIRGVFQIAKFIGLDNMAMVGVGMNIVFIDVALLLMYLTARKLFGAKKATPSLIVATFVLPLVLFYVPYFYTDTISLPFGIGLIYLYLNLREAKTRKKFVMLLVIMGIVLFIGAMIKMTVAIIFVAIVIDAFMRSKKGQWKYILLSMGLITVMIVPFLYVHNYLSNKYIHSQASTNAPIPLPLTHYIMLGMDYSSGGVFTTVSRQVTNLAKTQNEAIGINIGAMKLLWNDMGIAKYLHLLYRKSGMDWYSNGEYGISEMFSNMGVHDSNYKPTPLQTTIASGQEYPLTITNFMSAVQILLLVAVMIGSWRAWKSKRPDGLAVMRLAIFGLATFLLIWEANPRYTFNFLPIMILLATPIIYEMAPCVTDKLKNKYINTRRKILKY